MARSRVSSPAAEEFRTLLASERAKGKSTRVVAAEFGIGESTVRDILSGRRGVTEAKAERALRFATENPPPRFEVPTADGGFALVEPRTRRDVSRLGTYFNAIQRARETGDHRIVAEKMRGKTKIEGADGATVILDTDPRRLRDLSDAGLSPGRDQRFVSPKKSRRRA
jgi:hypothetical protein